VFGWWVEKGSTHFDPHLVVILCGLGPSLRGIFPSDVDPIDPLKVHGPMTHLDAVALRLARAARAGARAGVGDARQADGGESRRGVTP
jgi:hypothetical protein